MNIPCWLTVLRTLGLPGDGARADEYPVLDTGPVLVQRQKRIRIVRFDETRMSVGQNLGLPLRPGRIAAGTASIIREETVIIGGILNTAERELFHVARAFDLLAFVARTVQCGQQHGRKNRDDRNYNK